MSVSVERRVDLAVDQGVARLRLVRDDGLNAIDPAWVSALESAVDACERDEGLRALLISAEGRAFTVGGDLRHFASELDRLPEALDEMTRPYHAVLARLAELPVPIVCAVQGAVAGGGLGLLWCSDVVLATEDVKLATGFRRLGLSGDGGSSWWLPRLVGMPRARQLLLGGRILSATEAGEWGLVTRVVARDRLHDEALAEARDLASGPTLALGEMRRLLARALSVDVHEGLRTELEALLTTGATADAREGIAAFAGRREPGFTGQ
jgi:2-(1,2-epoxy-1,2-dihydrophenyl)acetyl-CoA isomerase